MTGAARGVGAATADAFARAGAHVFIADPDAEALAEAAGVLGLESMHFEPERSDHWEAFAELAGEVEILVNHVHLERVHALLVHASARRRGTPRRQAPASFEHPLRALFANEAMVRGMRARRRGVVINVVTAQEPVTEADGLRQSVARRAITEFVQQVQGEVENYGIELVSMFPVLREREDRRGYGHVDVSVERPESRAADAVLEVAVNSTGTKQGASTGATPALGTLLPSKIHDWAVRTFGPAGIAGDAASRAESVPMRLS